MEQIWAIFSNHPDLFQWLSGTRSGTKKPFCCHTTHIFLKFHPNPNIQASASQIIWNGVLGVLDGFYPCVGCFIGYFQQVKHFKAGPGAAGEAEDVVGLFAAPLRFPKLEPEPDIDPVVRRKTIGIAVNDVVVHNAKREP